MSFLFNYLGVGVAAIVSGEGSFVTVRDLLCNAKWIEILRLLFAMVEGWEGICVFDSDACRYWLFVDLGEYRP